MGAAGHIMGRGHRPVRLEPGVGGGSYQETTCRVKHPGRSVLSGART